MEDTVIYFKGIREEYLEKSISRFRLVGRPRYNDRVFNTTPEGLTIRTLPSASTYYSIKDAVTEDVIVPFGTGSIVSCDTESNFFNVWMNGFQPERYYKFEIKVVTGSASSATQIVNTYDDDFTFKVTR